MIVFDTENPAFQAGFSGETRTLKPLTYSHELLDYDFLKQFFPLDHSIFEDFGHSFFYVL